MSTIRDDEIREMLWEIENDPIPPEEKGWGDEVVKLLCEEVLNLRRQNEALQRQFQVERVSHRILNKTNLTNV